MPLGEEGTSTQTDRHINTMNAYELPHLVLDKFSFVMVETTLIVEGGMMMPVCVLGMALNITR